MSLCARTIVTSSVVLDGDPGRKLGVRSDSGLSSVESKGPEGCYMTRLDVLLDSVGVSTILNRITANNHGLITGDRILYDLILYNWGWAFGPRVGSREAQGLVLYVT